MLSLDNWNVLENNRWFARLVADGPGVSVELYLTQANAVARVNRRAYGVSLGYGALQEVALFGDNGQTITTFQPDTWHVKVTGLITDTTAKIVRVNPFVDMPEINHDVYLNADLSLARGQYEIAMHTNNRHVFSVSVATHYPNIAAGAVASLAVSDRNIAAVGQVARRSIKIERDSLTEDIDLVAFEGVKR
jgi:hypothetical protein